MTFEFEPLAIAAVIAVRPQRHRDERGYFTEVYRRDAFEAAGIGAAFVQDNLTRSTHGVLRGLHYQLPPGAQGKLVGCVSGRVFDVAVDLRRGGPTFGRWVGRVLDAEDGEMLWIPPGFAHGYLVLSDVAHVFYKVTEVYAPDLNRGLRWDDPTVAIEWPLNEPVLSAADRRQPDLATCDNPFRWEAATHG
jgi:dTDP-4-dehydrorhamnose 3,5-epimerase